MPYYRVEQGECVESIAHRHGLSFETVWKDPNNEALRNKRKHHNLLMPGDELFIPDIRVKRVSVSTGRFYRFWKKGAPTLLRLKLRDGGEPRANVLYTLVVDGHAISDQTDAEGVLQQVISPRVKQALLRVGEEEEEMTVLVGCVDPLTECSGVQQRLANLGYFAGPNSEESDEAARQAIDVFQDDEGLEASGEIDQQTRAKLGERHGS